MGFFSPKLKPAFAPILVIGIVIVLGFVLGIVFGPADISRLGLFSLRQQDQQSQAAAVLDCNDNLDNDGDGLIDEEDPGCSSAFDASESVEISLDADRDGFTEALEVKIGTDPNKSCATSGANGGPSATWPLDLKTSATSYNKINTEDLATFMAPIRRIDTKEGDRNYDKRWDLTGDGRINIEDMAKLTSGPTGYPPMFEGKRAFNGPECLQTSAPPTANCVIKVISTGSYPVGQPVQVFLEGTKAGAFYGIYVFGGNSSGYQNVVSTGSNTFVKFSIPGQVFNIEGEYRIRGYRVETGNECANSPITIKVGPLDYPAPQQ